MPSILLANSIIPEYTNFLQPKLQFGYNEGSDFIVKRVMAAMAKHVEAEIYPLGDHALIVRLSDKAEPKVILRVRTLYERLKSEAPYGLIELVPAQNALAVYYDPLSSGFEQWSERLRRTVAAVQPADFGAVATVEIPVCYEPEYSPDLPVVAQAAGLSREEVVRLHCGADYVVGMIGFVPGFPYLAGLPKALNTPRRTEPRTRVPAGSVGIGGSQTGIYPAAIPGGWQLIGRTPIRLFRPEGAPPSLLAPGNKIKFVPISADRFAELERANQ